MNSKDMLVMYDYHYWANRRILQSANKLSVEQFAVAKGRNFSSLRGVLVHMLDTECRWRTMCQMNTPEGFADLVETDFPTVEVLAQRWTHEEQTMRDYLAQLPDGALDHYAGDTRGEGTGWKVVRWQALWNIINHATEHRSEAAALVTELGFPPGELDVAEYLEAAESKG